MCFLYIIDVSFTVCDLQWLHTVNIGNGERSTLDFKACNSNYVLKSKSLGELLS